MCYVSDQFVQGICKFKILGGGNLNIDYKSFNRMNHKKGGTKFRNFRGGKQKGGKKIFDSNLVVGNLEENYVKLAS